jgi:uncharacterized OsmC-like protein
MTVSTLACFTLRGIGEGFKQTVAIERRPLFFAADGRRAFGGSDAATSPVDFALGALMSSTQVTGQIVASGTPSILLGRWEVVVKGSVDRAFLREGGDGVSNFRDVELAVSVETNLDDDAFAEFSQDVERRCPVTQLFRRSGVSLTTRWTAKPLAETGAELTRLASWRSAIGHPAGGRRRASGR